RHGIGHVGELGRAHESALHLVVVDTEIIGHVALSRFRGLENDGELLRLVLDLDGVVIPNEVRRDVDALAIDADMAVIDELPRGEGRRHELHAVDDGIEPTLQQLDEIGAGVAASPRSLFIEAAELALADIGVIALELLLRHELRAEIGRLLAPLPMLAGTVVAAVQRALGTAPEIDPEASIDLVLRPFSLAHRRLIRFVDCCCPNRSRRAGLAGRYMGRGPETRVLGNEARDYSRAGGLVNRSAAHPAPDPLEQWRNARRAIDAAEQRVHS